MSYTKDYRAYPPAFLTLLEAASIREVTIPCADEKDAKRLEGRLHAFFGVLHRSAKSDPAVIPLDNLCRQIKVKASGSSLVAMPRDMEQDNRLILTALGVPSIVAEAGGAPMSPEMREMFAKGLTTAPESL